jgi:hypothetical protein
VLKYLCVPVTWFTVSSFITVQHIHIMSIDLKAEGAQLELAESHIVEGKTSKKGIVLRPQPTNDPNEPLVRLSL